MEELEKKQKPRPARFTQEDFEKANILLNLELEKLTKNIIEYKKLMSEIGSNFKKGCGKKRGALAKQKQLDIIHTLILFQNAKQIKFTANFCNRIAVFYTKKSIQKQLLYKFFSYKKQNTIIFNKKAKIEDFCPAYQFNIFLEQATLLNKARIEIIEVELNKTEEQKEAEQKENLIVKLPKNIL